MIFRETQSIRIPALGFGTYPLTGAACVRTVSAALETGYRHFDTAQLYDNETQVGEALAESDIPRGDLFITTKVWITHLTQAGVYSSTLQSLDRLGLDYVDLLLIHWPTKDMDLAGCLTALEELKDQGRARLVGVSNFSVTLLKKALALKPGLLSVHQFEYHPFLNQDALLRFGRDHGLLMTAYSPLAQGQAASNEILETIGRHYGKTASQVALRWLVQQPGVMAIPKAARLEHIRSNFDIFDFELSAADMKRIHDLRGESRLVDPAWGPEWDQ